MGVTFFGIVTGSKRVKPSWCLNLLLSNQCCTQRVNRCGTYYLAAASLSVSVGAVVEDVWSGDGSFASARAHLPKVLVRGGVWTALSYLRLCVRVSV